MVQRWWILGCALTIFCVETSTSHAQKTAAKKRRRKKDAPPALKFPPTLPNGERVVTDKSEAFLKPTETIDKDVAIAKTPPTVDFLYFPGQDYPGNPWSNWGDSLAINGLREVCIGYGYCSGQEAVVHFGLGNVGQVDVEVELPHGRGTLRKKDVTANQRIIVTP